MLDFSTASPESRQDIWRFLETAKNKIRKKCRKFDKKIVVFIILTSIKIGVYSVADDEGQANMAHSPNFQKHSDEQFHEAIRRMRIIGIPEKIINSFRDDGTLHICEPSEGTFIKASQEIAAESKKYEAQIGQLVYLIIRSRLPFGDHDAYLAVHPNQKHWKDEMKEYKRTEVVSLYCYVKNNDFPQKSSCGYVGLQFESGKFYVKFVLDYFYNAAETPPRWIATN